MEQPIDQPPVTKDSIVTLREVTRDNLSVILKLKVKPEQDKCVASNAVSIAQAHFYPEEAWFRAIYADEVPVGFIMCSIEENDEQPYLWRFMIDARYQKLGFGAQAIRSFETYALSLPASKRIKLSCVPGENGPMKFYEKLGYAVTGEMDDDEAVMVKKLR